MADNDQNLPYNENTPAAEDEAIQPYGIADAVKEAAQAIGINAKQDTKQYQNAQDQASNGNLDALSQWANQHAMNTAMGTIGFAPESISRFSSASPYREIGIMDSNHSASKINGNIVGKDYASYLPGDAQDPQFNKASVINNVQIDPKHQGQGVGTSLLNSFENDAQKAGSDGIILKAKPLSSQDPQDLNSVVQYYKQHGYEPIGSVDHTTNTQTMIKSLPQKKVTAKVPYADGGDVQDPSQNGTISEPDALVSPDQSDTLPEGFQPESEVYGTAGQQALTGLEGLGQGIAGPIATAAERGLSAAGVPNLTPEDIEARERVNPFEKGIATVGGIMTPGSLLGKAMGAAGEAWVAGNAVTPLAKIGSTAAKLAIENAVFQGSDELSQMVLNDGELGNHALLDIGLAGALGGVMGAGLGGASVGINKLWDAAGASKTGQVLKAISNKIGGIDGVEPGTMDDLAANTGVNLSPFYRAGISEDPWAQTAVKNLQQTDTNSSGKAVQEILTNDKKMLGDSLIRSLGKDPDYVESLQDLSKADQGKNIGMSAADEFEKVAQPYIDSFEDLKAKTGSAPLETLTEGKPIGSIGTPQPSLIQDAVQKIQNLADVQGWSTSPSSPIMSEVNRVIKELPLQKTVGDLGNYISQVGDNTYNPLNKSITRAGSMMKRILEDTQFNAMQNSLGEKAGPAAIEQLAATRQGYQVLSGLKDALNERLGIKGANASNFADKIRDMAKFDGESIVNRLSGKNDANLFNVLGTSFPNTLEAVRNYHVDSLLKAAADKAAPGMTINSERLLSLLNNKSISPELRNVIAPPEVWNRINGIGSVIDKFDSLPHNFSNTARTIDSLMGKVPGTVAGIVGGLLSHSPGIGVAIKLLSDSVGSIKSAGDMALLRYLYENKPINTGAFKEMAETIQSAVDAKNTMQKASKDIFSPDSNIIPIKSTVSDKTRASINKQLDKIQENPNILLKNQQKAAYYLPNAAQAMTFSATQMANYLIKNRPQAKQESPLDPEIEPSPMQMTEYNNKLDLCQNPMLAMNKIKDGTLSSSDINVLQNCPVAYQSMQKQVMQSLVNAHSKGIDIPYPVRQAVSLFLGNPVDSTLSQQSIMAAQLANVASTPQAPQNNAPNRRQSGNKSKLEGMSNMYKTGSQARDSREQKR